MTLRHRATALLAATWLLIALQARAEPPTSAPQADAPGAGAADALTSLERAQAELDAARTRLDRANAAYGTMRARDYPRGDARAAIVKERDEARRGYEAASRRYTEMLETLHE